MKYTTTRVDKNFNGYTSVRDYIVDGVIKRGDGLIIVHNGKAMTLIPEEVKNAKQFHTIKFESKVHPGQEYSLVDFKFIPDDEKAKQGELFNA